MVSLGLPIKNSFCSLLYMLVMSIRLNGTVISNNSIIQNVATTEDFTTLRGITNENFNYR